MRDITANTTIVQNTNQKQDYYAKRLRIWNLGTHAHIFRLVVFVLKIIIILTLCDRELF